MAVTFAIPTLAEFLIIPRVQASDALIPFATLIAASIGFYRYRRDGLERRVGVQRLSWALLGRNTIQYGMIFWTAQAFGRTTDNGWVLLAWMAAINVPLYVIFEIIFERTGLNKIEWDAREFIRLVEATRRGRGAFK